MPETKKYNRITRHLTQCLAGANFPTHVSGHGLNPKTQEFEPTVICMADVIQRVLENKIISKSEVDALRKDAENMQSAQDAYNYTESLNADLRRENKELKERAHLIRYGRDFQIDRELTALTNLTLDAWALAMYPPVIRERGQLIRKCDICGVIEPENATHGHSDFEKFVRRLKFWR